jgi:phage shock protein A
MSELAGFLRTEAKARKANDDGIWELLNEAADDLERHRVAANAQRVTMDKMRDENVAMRKEIEELKAQVADIQQYARAVSAGPSFAEIKKQSKIVGAKEA